MLRIAFIPNALNEMHEIKLKHHAMIVEILV